MDLRLLVTGTGRCGTQWMHHLLTGAGVTCGHEWKYGPGGPRPTQLPAESSWLAVPYLHTVDRAITNVAVVYREPERVIGSYLRLRFFTDPRHQPFLDYALQHITGLGEALARSPLDAAERFYQWLNTTAMDAEPDLVFRIDRPPLARIADLAGVTEHKLAAAAAKLPTDVGHHVSWPTDTHTRVSRETLQTETLAVFDTLEWMAQ